MVSFRDIVVRGVVMVGFLGGILYQLYVQVVRVLIGIEIGKGKNG